MPTKARSPQNDAPNPDPWRYEAIIADLESGRLPLAEVITQFEQAMESLQRCEAYLAEKRAQVDILIETLTDA
jgi:exodeoxyribonuclease VII small subunit